TVTAQDRLPGEAWKLEHLATAPGAGGHLLRVAFLSQNILCFYRGHDHEGAGSRAHRRRVGHVIEMSVSDQNDIRPFHVGGLEAEWRKKSAAVEVSAERKNF